MDSRKRHTLAHGPDLQGTSREFKQHHQGGTRDTSIPFEEIYRIWGNTENMEVNGFGGFTHVRCPGSATHTCHMCSRHFAHVDSLVIAVDGACPGNGRNRAVKSACGVYFGRLNGSSPHRQENLAWRVDDTPGYAHTSQRAEQHAALRALNAVEHYVMNGGQWSCDDCPSPCRVKHVVIKSDSAYLVNSTMTSHIKKWVAHGWRTASKTPVKNRDLWEQLISEVENLKKLGAVMDFRRGR